jgi:hypothetical protein
LTDDVDEQEMSPFDFALHDQIAPPLLWTLRRAEGLDCKLRGDLDVVDVLTVTMTMIREPVGCQQRGRA